MKAQTVTDVILGEAVHGTKTERYNDMLGIASVIYNRSMAGGVTPQDVVSVRSQFNAYGKDLPAGVARFQPLAEQAWNEVVTNGPVHNATYYATEKASKNLPKGLKEVTRTAGHVYFEDPEGRSFKTASGYVRPNQQALASVSLPEDAPIPTPRPDVGLAAFMPDEVPVPTPRPDAGGLAAQEASAPRGLGMAALLPGGSLNFYHPGQENISPGLRAALEGASAEVGRTLGINSGLRSPERNRNVGGARNSYHMRGQAADIDMSGMSPDQRQQLVYNLKARGAGGVGTYTRYPDMLHVDMRQSPNGDVPWFMHDSSNRNMSGAPAWFQEMEAARGLYFPDEMQAPTPRPDPNEAPPLEAAPVGEVVRGGDLPPVGAEMPPEPLAAAPVGEVQRASLPPLMPPEASPVTAALNSGQQSPSFATIEEAVDQQIGGLGLTEPDTVSLPEFGPTPTPRPADVAEQMAAAEVIAPKIDTGPLAPPAAPAGGLDLTLPELGPAITPRQETGPLPAASATVPPLEAPREVRDYPVASVPAAAAQTIAPVATGPMADYFPPAPEPYSSGGLNVSPNIVAPVGGGALSSYWGNMGGLGGTLAGAALGGLLGGPVGAAAGGLLGSGALKKVFSSDAVSGSRPDTAVAPSMTGYLGKGLDAMSAVFGGKAAPGALAESLSNPGTVALSLPGGLVARSYPSEQHGYITSIQGLVADDMSSPNAKFGKVAALAPDTKSWSFVSPQEAASLASKGWSVSISPTSLASIAPPAPAEAKETKEAAKGVAAPAVAATTAPSIMTADPKEFGKALTDLGNKALQAIGLGAFGMTTGGLGAVGPDGFPAAPAPDPALGLWGPTAPSYADMAGISPAAADAISAGSAGLY